MNIVIFCHSIESDWNHGNAHFLRGLTRSLQRMGHTVRVHEPRDAWSRRNLVEDHGEAALRRFREAYPSIRSTRYTLEGLDLDEALEDVDLVLVHEWNDPELVKRVGAHHEQAGTYTLLFHDTHHRSVTAPEEMQRYDLDGYDGVLAFGDAVRDRYIEHGWTDHAWTLHEAADAERFRPLDLPPSEGEKRDVVWIGNWGDGERTRELHEYLLDPVRDLRLTGTVHGVRYPEEGRRAVRDAGLAFDGWVSNVDVPQVYARHRFTVHVPRRPYVEDLPGIPTIRVFEALACGTPLLSAHWEDREDLFTPGDDFLVAHDATEMREHMRTLKQHPDLRRRLAQHGRETVLDRHTTDHRARELLSIHEEVQASRGGAGTPTPLEEVREQAPSTPAATGSPGEGLRIAWFGSSLVSSYWNGAATYYRGLLRALHERGHDVTFYEPDAYDRQAHRDIQDPAYAEVVVYPDDADAARKALEDARGADVVVKASGVGVHDELLARGVLDLQDEGTRAVYWDVDAPATLAGLDQDPKDPLHELVPRYDAVLTYGGGPPVVEAYEAHGARRCVPVYNAVDPTTHHPVDPDPRYEADLAFMGNRLPDREERVDTFLLEPARKLPDRSFILAGAGWEERELPGNVEHVGHVGTGHHNAFNSTPLAVLNVNRESMAEVGWSPATRVFEAAGAGACLVTDSWPGLGEFLEPGRECLAVEDSRDVVEALRNLTREEAQRVGEAARQRVLEEHTYAHRARRVEEVLLDVGAEPSPREVVV